MRAAGRGGPAAWSVRHSSQKYGAAAAAAPTLPA